MDSRLITDLPVTTVIGGGSSSSLSAGGKPHPGLLAGRLLTVGRLWCPKRVELPVRSECVEQRADVATGRSLRLRRPRRAIVVLAGSGRANGRSVEALAESLDQLGVETIHVGREDDASRIATLVARERADTVELCLTGTGGVALLRNLLRALNEIGRREVTIVVHRVV